MMNEDDRIILPGAPLLNPVPVVMVSCQGQESGSPNIITIAWTGTVCSEPPMVSISIRPNRYSYGLICESGEFVVNLVNQSLAKACDYCGVRSGAKEDKFTQMELTPVKAKGLRWTPAIKEAPVSLSCKVVSRQPLGTHDLFLGEIVAVSADPKYMNTDGKLCLEEAGLVHYLHGDYFARGRKLGFFGYAVASDKAYRRRMTPKPSSVKSAPSAPKSSGEKGSNASKKKRNKSGFKPKPY